MFCRRQKINLRGGFQGQEILSDLSCRFGQFPEYFTDIRFWLEGNRRLNLQIVMLE